MRGEERGQNQGHGVKEYKAFVGRTFFMLSASLSYSSRSSCSSGESSGGESSALDPGRSSIVLVTLRKLVDGRRLGTGLGVAWLK